MSTRNQQTWLFGALPDLLLSAGLLYLFIASGLIILSTGAREAIPAAWISYILLIISGSHYGGTLLRVYEDQAERKYEGNVIGLFAACLVVGMIAILGGCAPSSREPATPDAVTSQDAGSEFNVYFGGPIITMESAQPAAEAVVTNKEGRIVFVGDRDAAFELYAGAKRVDLAGRVVMPGFIEQHLHPVLGALMLSIPIIAPEAWELPTKTWPAVTGHQEYVDALRSIEADIEDENETLWTWGFNQYFHGELSRELLDSISGTRPIAVWHRSGHEFFLNSAMLDHYGINQDEIDATSEEVANQIDLPRGHFYEAGAFSYLVPIIFPDLGNAERFQAGLIQMVEMLQKNGVTAYNEPGAIIPEYVVPLYQAILGADSTPMYSFFIPESKTAFAIHGEDGVLAAVEQTAETFPETGKLRFFKKHIKILADGAIISQLMQMRDGYLDGHHGEWIQSPEEVDKLIGIFWKAGYQIHVHVNGDLGLDTVIEIMQRHMNEYPREDHRFTVVHFANSTDEQVRRLGEMGAIISANPYYVTGFGEKFGEVGLGVERAHAMVRLGTAEKEGISISLHSDLPMAPARPLFLAWSAATRHTNEGTTLRPDLALSREAALRAITIEAAYSWRMEDSLGSIKVGKIANFTILEENPFEVELDRLKDIPVYATVFEGRLFPVKQ
jgi:predicted amidohydrolase YtcJ